MPIINRIIFMLDLYSFSEEINRLARTLPWGVTLTKWIGRSRVKAGESFENCFLHLRINKVS